MIQLYGSEIYNDYAEDIHWIRGKILEETSLFPEEVLSIVNYYIRQRLIIIPTKAKKTRGIMFDYELGRPVPYAVFWFADAFGYNNKQVVRELGLGLVYSAIVTTIRDDLIDNEASCDSRCIGLMHYYNHRYFEIFESLFDKNSSFWYYLTESISEVSRYERWNLLIREDNITEPFSEQFLHESSRYFSAVVFPSFAALAVLVGAEEKIPVIRNWLKYFSMGWRVYDDFCDWKRDLSIKKYNNSSILLSTANTLSVEKRLDIEDVYNMFLDPNFINNAYHAILHFYDKARLEIAPLNNYYLNKFMKEQIHFHTKRRDLVLKRSNESREKIIDELRKTLQPIFSARY